MKKVYIPQLTPHGGTLTGYLHDPDDIYIFRGIRPGILVIPGGGYQKLAGREKDPVAFEYFAEGFNTFVLEYSIQEYAPGLEPLGLKPLKEASAAIIAFGKMRRTGTPILIRLRLWDFPPEAIWQHPAPLSGIVKN